LHRKGLNRVVHGHSNFAPDPASVAPGVRVSDDGKSYHTEDGVQISGVDFSAGKVHYKNGAPEYYRMEQRSVGVIGRENGSFDSGPKVKYEKPADRKAEAKRVSITEAYEAFARNGYNQNIELHRQLKHLYDSDRLGYEMLHQNLVGLNNKEIDAILTGRKAVFTDIQGRNVQVYAIEDIASTAAETTTKVIYSVNGSTDIKYATLKTKPGGGQYSAVERAAFQTSAQGNKPKHVGLNFVLF
jgi:hypothetical protein